MQAMTRREFAATLALVANRKLHAAPTLDQTLEAGISSRRIPAVAAALAGPDKIIWKGAFGRRDHAGPPVTPTSIFGIASMTKAITTVAALQLVEQGKLKLDDPVAKHLPQLSNLQVLDGFDPAGKPILQPAARPVLLHHLLTHTSGFVYSIWDENLKRYSEHFAVKGATPPLVFEPGERWEYGTNLDWAGRLVEAVSGQTLEDYFQRHILQPLGMRDTSYILPRDKFDRLVTGCERQPDGSLKESPRKPPQPPKSFNGGGGLYSTVLDYIQFQQMILRRGQSPAGRILSPALIEKMTTNQIGEIQAGILHTTMPSESADVDFHPGRRDGFTYGFLINSTPHERGRSAGSLAWAGIMNTFYWIDPKRHLCATIMMQFLPFCDPQAIGLLNDFEQAVYAQP
jgi:methyl acetate hydrolase